MLRVIDELNYRPNGIARAMRTNRTDTIGVVVARLSNPLYPELLDILNRTLSRLGKRMVVWDSEGSSEAAASDAIRQRIVDGVIFTTATARSTALHEAVRAGVPVVLVNRTVAGLGCDQVSSDNRGGAELVAKYLVGNGRRRIAFISGDTEPSTIHERERGFLMTLEELGVPLEPSMHLRGPFSHEFGCQAMRSLLELAVSPDAVFCVNDVMAFGALDAAKVLGRSVPDDVWVIGFDDLEMASWSMMSLSTVRQPRTQLINEGVRLLLERIEGAEAPLRHICQPTELVNRFDQTKVGHQFAAVRVGPDKAYSRGFIRLAGRDPKQEPVVMFNLLSDRRDMARMVAGIRFAYRTLMTDPVPETAYSVFAGVYTDWIRRLSNKSLLNRMITGAGAFMLDRGDLPRKALMKLALSSDFEIHDMIDDDKAVETFARSAVLGNWHACGTCRMGSSGDPATCVDPEGRVLGVQGLRVVDASLMPSIPCANINLTTIMIAEKISDSILRAPDKRR